MRFEILAFLLLLGCVDIQNNETQNRLDGASSSQFFFLPESKINYTAHYVIYEDGKERYETVWREGKRMKVEAFTDAEKKHSILFYFLENQVFFCIKNEKEECNDITNFFESNRILSAYDINLTGAVEVEKVPIGNTEGQCYLLPSSSFFEERKICLTDLGVLAYDELSYAGRKKYVRYLVELSYFIEGTPWKGEN